MCWKYNVLKEAVSAKLTWQLSRPRIEKIKKHIYLERQNMSSFSEEELDKLLRRQVI